jgi:F-box protein 9
MDEVIFPIDEEEAAAAEDEPPNIERDLDNFRQQWKQELDGRNTPPPGGRSNQNYHLLAARSEPSVEDTAKYLFLQGVSAEQNGKLYEAISYYRRAVQLVPDVEFRIEYQKAPTRDRQESESSVDSGGCPAEFDEDLSNLIQHFQKLKVKVVCEPHLEQNMTHISSLPVELIVYILKWVVSNDVDVVALENISKVCRGFYICARDDELWRLICQRVWGVNCGRPTPFGSWRNMFVGRPHLKFHGCYICKMSYYRLGEQGVDSFYRPFHLVEYYRYLRFFPEGKMMMLTSPDYPYTMVPKLRSRNGRVQGMLYGYYKMAGDRVTAVLKRRPVDYNANMGFKYKRRQQQNQNQKDSEQSFHVELIAKNAGKRLYSQLAWSKYSVHTTYKLSGEETVANFELTNKAYPPLFFSTVKSYTTETSSLLA